MKRVLALLLLPAVLASCGATPQPTARPPTQTPWIVVITLTAESESGTPLPHTPENSATPTSVARTTATRAPALTGTSTAPLPVGTTPVTRQSETPTAAPAVPTDSATLGTVKYPPVTLLEPPGNRPVSWKNTVLLQWSSAGELAEDEYYHLHLERRPTAEGEQWYGDYVLTKETEYRAEGPFLAPFHLPAAQGYGVVYWWVWVVRRTGQDQNGKPIGVDISPFSEERTLILEPKPAGE